MGNALAAPEHGRDSQLIAPINWGVDDRLRALPSAGKRHRTFYSPMEGL